ncbi:AI-2E family transporter [Halorarum salinum]
MLALTAFVLAGVLATVVFAVTVAYVLYPLRQELRARGCSDRLAALAATAAAFLGVVALAAPLGFVLYRRRSEFVDFLRSVPPGIPVELGGFSLVVETAPLLDAAVDAVRALAASTAAAAPVFALKLLLFVLLVYGLLYAPGSPRAALLRLCPDEYHDVLFALHRRTAHTLRAIYVLQAATALGTFVVAFVLFWLLGYGSPFALAVVAGVLQFVPVLGPSAVVAGLAAMDLVAGEALRAATVLVLGLFLVGFAPDAIIRPRLAGGTTDLPVSVYFVGFVGGLLTLGAIGFVLGPLVVALLAEVVSLLSEGPVSEGTAPSNRPAGEASDPTAGESVDVPPDGSAPGPGTPPSGAVDVTDSTDG